MGGGGAAGGGAGEVGGGALVPVVGRLAADAGLRVATAFCPTGAEDVPEVRPSAAVAVVGGGVAGVGATVGAGATAPSGVVDAGAGGADGLPVPLRSPSGADVATTAARSGAGSPDRGKTQATTAESSTAAASSTTAVSRPARLGPVLSAIVRPPVPQRSRRVHER